VYRYRFLTRANKRISLGSAAALLAFSAFLGQLLGLLRVKLVNANFPALGPDSTDAYFAAFKIPDFFFFTVAAGALGVAFIPFLTDHLSRGDKKGAWRLSNSLLNLLAIIMLVVGVIIFLFAKPLIHYIVAPNLSPEQLYNASTIMKIVAFNPFLFTIAGILMAVQQTFGRFFFYAMGPLIYNLTVIVSIFVFKGNIGLIGLGIGALIGAILQLLIAFFGFTGLSFRWKWGIHWEDADFRKMLKQLPPRSLDQGVDSLNSIVETNFARRLGEGNISYYENAFVLHTAPTMLVGTAIATAAFPRLADRLSNGRSDLFRRDFLQILRVIIWIILPISIVVYFSRGYLARLIFTRDAPEIAVILGFFVGAIVFRSIYTILSRWFYAHKDTKTPLFVSLFAIALNIFLAYTLSRPTAYGVAGLAMAQSIVAAAEVGILFLIMVIRDHKLLDFSFFSGIIKIVSVTGFTVIATFAMVSILPLESGDRGFVMLSTKLGSITFVALFVHVGMSHLFGLEEAKPIVKKIREIVLSPVKI